MWLVNKRNFLLSVFILSSSFVIAQTEALSEVLSTKLDNALSTIYGEEEVELELYDLKADSKELKGSFYKIKSTNGQLKGYAYLAQAPSMKNVFDYLVVFNKDLEIEKAKVLIYREKHGRQIGSVRWLSQFNGMSLNDRPKLGSEVDGISGATISSRNMTIAINELLAALADYKSKGLI